MIGLFKFSSTNLSSAFLANLKANLKVSCYVLSLLLSPAQTDAKLCQIWASIVPKIEINMHGDNFDLVLSSYGAALILPAML